MEKKKKNFMIRILQVANPGLLEVYQVLGKIGCLNRDALD